MSVQLHREKIRLNLDTLGFAIDIAMILLIVANLSLIIFDWFFSVQWLQSLLSTYTPCVFYVLSRRHSQRFYFLGHLVCCGVPHRIRHPLDRSNCP